MSRVEEYRAFRKASSELGKKVIKTALDGEAMDQGGKQLGVVHDKVLVFDDQTGPGVLADFTLFDCRVNGKNAFESYREMAGRENEAEEAILDGFLASHTSLFRIASIAPGEATLILQDLLSHATNLKLVDVALSETASPGWLVFTRLVPFTEGLNMTSGIAFVFPGHLEAYLLRQYKKLARNVRSDSEAARRFVAFYELHKKNGLPIRYE
ncbi:MAG: hypothetical protein Q7R39_16890 [Dehalococcoidia bacterium]|nr:hypothetical protein [Dehalococcoidia bacterium]